MTARILWCYILLLTCKLGSALIAFDCQNQSMNITTFSLTEIGQCKQPTSDVEISKERIQLVQIADFELVPVIQCKIHVTRIISYCGMHSHMVAVNNGVATYLYPINREMCQSMHQTRSLTNFYKRHIDHLVINGTSYATVVMAGQIVSENSCNGEDYEDHKGSWSNVVVQAALEITLYQNFVPATVNENKITLEGGTTCRYNDMYCMDTVRGQTFWQHGNPHQCAANKYTVLYEGTATRITPRKLSEETYDTTIYSVDEGDKIFAMPINKPTFLCGQSAYETDHPKFFIIKPSENGLFYFTKTTTNVFNMDPTAYTNTKVVFVERHIRGQLSKLYVDVVMQKCALEQQVLRNLQTLAVTSPAEFAYAKMKTPGYTAINYGEVIHIIKCMPVEVTIRNTQSCYHELPVSYDNKTLFMTPRNRILQKYATEINCDPFLYPAYHLNNKWYKISREVHEIPNPQILEPTNNDKWRYVSPAHLFKGGIYTQEDMLKLQEHLLLPTERQAVTGILSRGMIGLSTDLQGTTFKNLIDDETIQSWTERLWGKLWSWFINVGTVTSGLMGIYLAGKGLKFVIDTLIHGMVLYNIFGTSFKLIAALLDSVTMYCIHRHQVKKFAQSAPEPAQAASEPAQAAQAAKALENVVTKDISEPERTIPSNGNQTVHNTAYPNISTMPQWLNEK